MVKLKKAPKFRKAIAIGLILTLGVIIIYLVIFRPKLQNSEFQNYILNNQLDVGTTLIDERQQVYYEYKGKRTYVTKDEQNHLNPKANGHYIVWQEETAGQSQVVLHDLKTGINIELSMLGNNSNASISGTLVAWQGSINNSATVFYFDGNTVKKIESDYPAIRPFVRDGQILYARQTDARSDLWQTVLYDVRSSKSEIIIESSADKAAWPRFENGQIRTDNAGSASYYY